MRRIFILLLVFTVLVQIPIGVSAAEISQFKNIDITAKNIDSILYKDGEVIVKYNDKIMIPDEPGVVETGVPISLEKSGPNVTPMYRSSLTPVNNYEYLWAWSQCTNRSIDRMRVECQGWRDNGFYIGKSDNQNPVGTEVMALSAYVEPKDFGLDYQVGQGTSLHYYECAGYIPHTDYLSWRR